MRTMLKLALPTMLLMLAGQGALAQSACLGNEQIRDAITAGKAVPASVASRAARGAVPGDVVRVRLCQEDEALSYLVTLLRPDGRVTHVTIEGTSGKVARVK